MECSPPNMTGNRSPNRVEELPVRHLQLRHGWTRTFAGQLPGREGVNPDLRGIASSSPGPRVRHIATPPEWPRGHSGFRLPNSWWIRRGPGESPQRPFRTRRCLLVQAQEGVGEFPGHGGICRRDRARPFGSEADGFPPLPAALWDLRFGIEDTRGRKTGAKQLRWGRSPRRREERHRPPDSFGRGRRSRVCGGWA